MVLSALMAKSLGLVRQLVPNAAVIGALVNPQYSGAELQSRELQDAARVMKQQIAIVNARTDHEIDGAFANLVEHRVAALVVANDPFFTSRREKIIALAARRAMPAIYTSVDWINVGGLMSYGASFAVAYRQAGLYTGRILKGVKPSELPVMQPTKFDLVINLKTAKALGLIIPPNLLAIADEAIE
jgi:putative ABC transport system substrate-binding protein